MSNSEFSGLSDDALDSAYSAAVNTGNSQTGAALGIEIIDRLATPRSFFTGLLGFERFPIYAAHTKFSQVDSAQSAVSDNAAKVGAKIENVFTFGTTAVIVVGLAFIVWKVWK